MDGVLDCLFPTWTVCWTVRSAMITEVGFCRFLYSQNELRGCALPFWHFVSTQMSCPLPSSRSGEGHDATQQVGYDTVEQSKP
jgi:hypothetical protein